MNEDQQKICDRLQQIDTDYLEAQEKSQNVIQNALQYLDLDVTDFLARLEAYSLEPKTGKAASNLAKFVLGSYGQWSKNEDADYSPLEQALWRSDRRTKYEKFRLLSMLYRWVEVGNELGQWELPLPALPTYLPSPVCPYSPETRKYWDRVDKLREAVIHSVKEKEPLGLENEVGRYLLSLILFGNVLDGQALKAVISSKLILQKAGEHVWVDIPIMTSRHSEAEIKRWYPDPVSEYLIQHSAPKIIKALTKLSRSKTFLEQVRKNVNRFLKESTYSKEPLNKNREIFEIASHALALESSPMNASYAARKVITHSMRQSAWLRMLGASPTAETEYQGERGNDQVGKKRRPVDQEEGDEEDTLNLGLLIPSVSTELLALRRDAFDLKLKAGPINDEENPTIVELIQSWSAYLLYEKKWFGRKPSPNIVASFISSFGQRLYRFAGDINLLILPEEGFEDIYWTILEDAESSSLKRKLSRAIRSFHEYLRQKFPEAVPTLQDAGSLKLGNNQIAVDANIINLDEYERCKRRLLTHPKLMQKSFRICEIAALIFVIGFRTGTRRQEVLKLRLADLHTSFLPELLIRPWAKRTLKTRASNRKIPLHALLSEEELEWLGDFWRRRRLEAGTSDPAAYLFADPNLKLDQIGENIFKVIHDVMKEECGDKTLRFHHLRHSFATWTWLRLHLSERPFIPEIFPSLPKTQEWLEQSGDLRKKLHLPDGPTRKYAYVVSSILGHSGPEMSLEHYIHSSDLVEYLMRPQIKSSARVQELFGVIKPTRVKEQNRLKEELFVPGGVKALDETSQRHIRIQSILNVARRTEANEHFYSEVSTGPIRQDDDIGILQEIQQLIAFHIAYVGKKLPDDLLLKLFGFSETQGRCLVRRIDELRAFLEPHLSKHDESISSEITYEGTVGRKQISLSPVRKMAPDFQDDLWSAVSLSPKLSAWRIRDLKDLAGNYENIRSPNRAGFRLDMRSQSELAMKFLRVHSALGLDKYPLAFKVYKGHKAKFVGRVRKKFGLDNDAEVGLLVPPKADTKKYPNTVVITPVRAISNKHEDSFEVPIMKYLLHVMAIYFAQLS